jgi:hypothetical protein
MRRPSLALAALLLLPLAGCGGSGHDRVDPGKMLEGAGAHPIRSASLDVDATIRIDRGGDLSDPIHLHLEGPYVSGGATAIPSFDWRFNASALGFPVGGHVISTGENVYLTVYGNRYEVGESAVTAVNERVAAAAQSGPPPDLAHLLSRPTVVSEGNAGGVDCEWISGAPRWDLIADQLGALTGAAGSAAPVISGSATACVGYDDRVLHGLDIDAGLTFPPEARSRLGGASGVHVEADIEIGDVGESQQIETPRGAFRPMRDLLLTLNDLGVPIPLG